MPLMILAYIYIKALGKAEGTGFFSLRKRMQTGDLMAICNNFMGGHKEEMPPILKLGGNHPVVGW